MRQLFLGLFVFVLILFGSFTSPSIIYADTQAEVIQRVDSDIQLLNTFLDKLESTTDPDILLNLLQSEFNSLQAHLKESSAFYSSTASTETDESVKNVLGKLHTHI